MRYLLAVALMVGVALGAGGVWAQEDVSLRPLIHGAASLVIPGLGQYLNGEYEKALTHFMVTIVLDVGVWYLADILPWWYPSYYLVSGVHALWALYSAIDAYETALELEGLSFHITPTGPQLSFSYNF
ncbi:MAG TPA: hypothetical protein ENI38_02140 [Candidatus Acetothermia bacterium]|nr:hypothetical protein [Candidatus Acetothermia bacterium]